MLYGNVTWSLGLVYNIFPNFSLDILNKCYDNRMYLRLATEHFETFLESPYTIKSELNHYRNLNHNQQKLNIALTNCRMT